MNKTNIIKALAKSPAALCFPAQEIINLAILIAATCLASKIEEIIRDVIESDKLTAADVIEEIRFKKENV